MTELIEPDNKSDAKFALVMALIVVAFVIGMVLGYVGGAYEMQQDIMSQAYERDLAVECLGKEGYHWDCK